MQELKGLSPLQEKTDAMLSLNYVIPLMDIISLLYNFTGKQLQSLIIKDNIMENNK